MHVKKIVIFVQRKQLTYLLAGKILHASSIFPVLIFLNAFHWAKSHYYFAKTRIWMVNNQKPKAQWVKYVYHRGETAYDSTCFCQDALPTIPWSFLITLKIKNLFSRIYPIKNKVNKISLNCKMETKKCFVYFSCQQLTRKYWKNGRWQKCRWTFDQQFALKMVPLNYYKPFDDFSTPQDLQLPPRLQRSRFHNWSRVNMTIDFIAICSGAPVKREKYV